MTDLRPLDDYDWPRIAQDLDAQGWAMLPGLCPPAAAHPMAQAIAPAAGASLPQAGHGNRLALPHPLPTPLARLRADLYRHLLPIARAWAAALGQDVSYPDDLGTYTEWNRRAGQQRSLCALQRLGAEDYQPLLMHTDGELIFPLRLIVLLSEPDRDFTGGEVVMTEQRPRMQSRPMVLPLRAGDAAVIAVSHRPVQGARDIYRVTARQAISRVRSGERVGLEMTLHDSP